MLRAAARCHARAIAGAVTIVPPARASSSCLQLMPPAAPAFGYLRIVRPFQRVRASGSAPAFASLLDEPDTGAPVVPSVCRRGVHSPHSAPACASARLRHTSPALDLVETRAFNLNSARTAGTAVRAHTQTEAHLETKSPERRCYVWSPEAPAGSPGGPVRRRAEASLASG